MYHLPTSIPVCQYFINCPNPNGACPFSRPVYDSAWGGRWDQLSDLVRGPSPPANFPFRIQIVEVFCLFF